MRIRIQVLPALRYEGFDLSRYDVGQTYDVEPRLAELLIERGYAEPVVLEREPDHAADKKR